MRNNERTIGKYKDLRLLVTCQRLDCLDELASRPGQPTEAVAKNRRFYQELTVAEVAERINEVGILGKKTI